MDGKNEDALKIYEKLLEFKPNDKYYLLHKAKCLHDLGRINEAIECCDTIINMDLSNDSAWDQKAICLFDLNKFDEALECINKAIELDSNRIIYLFTKADILFKLNRCNEVKEVLEKIKPDKLVYWSLLHGYYIKIKEYDNALDCVDEMLSLEYDYYHLFLKAQIYFELKNYDEAMKYCKEASLLNSDFDELNKLIEKIKNIQNKVF